jgi:hypothetical protein
VTLQPHVFAVLGEQWLSEIIASFVHNHQGFKEMTFANEKVHSAFVERLAS